MRIGLTYDLKTDYSAERYVSDDFLEEFDSEDTVEAITEEISSLGYAVVPFGGGTRCVEHLLKEKVDLVFNIAEGRGSRSREAHVPALLELMDIPHTGSDPLALAMSLDKGMTKTAVKSVNVNTPPFFVVRDKTDIEGLQGTSFSFPVIAKPLHEGSSMGIRVTAKTKTMRELTRRVEFLLKTYNSPVLVEEFVRGVDVTVGILGNGHEARVIGIMSILPKKKNVRPDEFIYSLEAKRNWMEEVEYSIDHSFKNGLSEKIQDDALKVFHLLGCRDIARVDFKVDLEKEIPYFLEINPLPGLNPRSGDLPILSRMMGISYGELIRSVLDSAFKRYGLANRNRLQSAGAR